MQKLAIDVGGVLIEKRDERGPDTNFDVNNVRWVPGAMDAVKTLSRRYELYILSFCGKQTERDTRAALNKSLIEFIPQDRWVFTRKREHKVAEMQNHGINTLVDDTKMIIDLVDAAGLRGLHFRGIKYKSWQDVVWELTQANHPDVFDASEFPALV